jgi:hypothetical protein
MKWEPGSICSEHNFFRCADSMFTFPGLRKPDKEAAWNRKATDGRVWAGCSVIPSRSQSFNCWRRTRN